MMIWESLTASVKTASGGSSASVSVSSRIDTANSRTDDNGVKNSNVVNSSSSSPSSLSPPRPSSLSLCITHDRFEHLLELLEAETQPSSSSLSLSDYTSVKFLQCTRLPPPQALRKMDRIQHLSFTQCHGLTSLQIDHHDHDDDHDDDRNDNDSCCCCWSTSIETLTITDCPDLMMFSKSSAGNEEQEDSSEDDDTMENDDTTRSFHPSPVSSSSFLKQLHQRHLNQSLQLSTLFVNVRKLCIVECGRKTVLSFFHALMVPMEYVEVETSRSGSSSSLTSTTSSSFLPNLKELHLQRNHLTSEDVAILFRRRLLQHQNVVAAAASAPDQLEIVNLLGNSIDTLGFVQQSLNQLDDYSHCGGDGSSNALMLGLRRLKQIILSGNPVMERKHPTIEKNIDDGTTHMDWSVSDDDGDGDQTITSFSSSSSTTTATGSSRSLMELSSSSSSSMIPFNGISGNGRIDGLSVEQINIVKLLQVAPQLHFFGYAFPASNLYSKEAQHLININKSGGRLLMPLPPMMLSDIRRTKTTECQPPMTKVPVGIWPYVFERSNRMYNVLIDDSENAQMKDTTIAKTSCCDGKSGLSATRNADALYFLLRHGSSFAGREAL